MYNFIELLIKLNKFELAFFVFLIIHPYYFDANFTLRNFCRNSIWTALNIWNSTRVFSYNVVLLALVTPAISRVAGHCLYYSVLKFSDFLNVVS